jgi:hypothetical protein
VGKDKSAFLKWGVRSAALRLDHDVERVENLTSRSPQIGALFNDEQRTFLKDVAGAEIQAEELQIFGDIKSMEWQWEEQDPAILDNVIAEFWDIPGDSVFELSRKTKASDQENKAKKFEEFFRTKGVKVDPDPASKGTQGA